MKLFYGLWLMAFGFACSHDSASVLSQSDSPKGGATPHRDSSVQKVSSKEVAAESDDVLPKAQVRLNNPECLSLGPKIRLPHYDPQSQLMLIGFLKTCSRSDGSQGFLKGSSFTAMGFPCSQGHGRIEKRGGTENNPGLISFSLQNACPMKPATTSEAEQALRQSLEIPKDSHLVAFIPLSVDFWEFEHYPESDTGFTPEIYSPQALSKGWAKFTGPGEGFKVKLYGRENSWDRGRFLFRVLGDLLPDGRHQFRLQVRGAEALDTDELAKVKGRCEALRPNRSCDTIFD